jgi:hypothetical protein
MLGRNVERFEFPHHFGLESVLGQRMWESVETIAGSPSDSSRDPDLALRACLKTERGCVEDQPQHGENTPRPRDSEACCGWSGTTQPRSGVFNQALSLSTRIRSLSMNRWFGVPALAGGTPRRLKPGLRAWRPGSWSRCAMRVSWRLPKAPETFLMAQSVGDCNTLGPRHQDSASAAFRITRTAFMGPTRDRRFDPSLGTQLLGGGKGAWL